MSLNQDFWNSLWKNDFVSLRNVNAFEKNDYFGEVLVKWVSTGTKLKIALTLCS